jgi:hypothetical protein
LHPDCHFQKIVSTSVKVIASAFGGEKNLSAVHIAVSGVGICGDALISSMDSGEGL